MVFGGGWVMVFGVVGGVIQYLVLLGCIFWALAGKADAVEVSGNSSGPGTTCRKQLRAWL